MARLDAAVSLFWVLLGIALCWSSKELGLSDPSGPGSGLFPFLAGLLVLAGGVGLLVRHVVTGGQPVPGEEIAAQFWEAPGAPFRTAMLIIVVAGMIIAVPWLGFALAGVIGLPILFRVIAPEKSWMAAIVTGVIAAGSMHLLFAVALGTPLPRGPLGF
ncbi:tripartite tricarboxylate transporter TctB family protein [Roseomonas stagni]|uniref:Tripartite tricarboxylate transporter TctB family protein n=1 Tax=Falsiroseomonas algicola TaxID=2716930 RepID=A0A6M1LRB3_9PROT|nr:tripartite tricarboxylate transporter TctB family protein [Falsiroseomonas algicola]NGM22549.1 tripartite tricarboxylate transporter TctB family protein [Falsiroseomonas algicola]